MLLPGIRTVILLVLKNSFSFCLGVAVCVTRGYQPKRLTISGGSSYLVFPTS